MLAVGIDRFGGPEVLRPRELADIEPGLGEITIDVKYCAVGLVDVLVRQGRFSFLSPPLTPGLSIAGLVRSVGQDVEGYKVGARVAAFMVPPKMGGYATLARAPAHLVVPLEIPAGEVSLETAAVAIVNGPTAYIALSDLAHVGSGDCVVVHGATGALAGMAAQIAKYLGARPLIGTVGSAAKADHAQKLGYDEVLLNTGPDWIDAAVNRTNGRGAAVILDPVGGKLRSISLEALAPLGRLIALGHSSGEPESPVSAVDLWLGNKAILGLNLGALAFAEPQRFQSAASKVLSLLADRRIACDVGPIVPLTEARQAHELLESRKSVGTILLDCER